MSWWVQSEGWKSNLSPNPVRFPWHQLDMLLARWLWRPLPQGSISLTLRLVIPSFPSVIDSSWYGLHSCSPFQHASWTSWFIQGTDSSSLKSEKRGWASEVKLYQSSLDFLPGVLGAAVCLTAVDWALDSWEEPDMGCTVSQMSWGHHFEGLFSVLSMRTWPYSSTAPCTLGFTSLPFPFLFLFFYCFIFPISIFISSTAIPFILLFTFSLCCSLLLLLSHSSNLPSFPNSTPPSSSSVSAYLPDSLFS
jgi:hypothetical protein